MYIYYCKKFQYKFFPSPGYNTGPPQCPPPGPEHSPLGELPHRAGPQLAQLPTRGRPYYQPPHAIPMASAAPTAPSAHYGQCPACRQSLQPATTGAGRQRNREQAYPQHLSPPAARGAVWVRTRRYTAAAPPLLMEPHGPAAASALKLQKPRRTPWPARQHVPSVTAPSAPHSSPRRHTAPLGLPCSPHDLPPRHAFTTQPTLTHRSAPLVLPPAPPINPGSLALVHSDSRRLCLGHYPLPHPQEQWPLQHEGMGGGPQR